MSNQTSKPNQFLRQSVPKNQAAPKNTNPHLVLRDYSPPVAIESEMALLSCMCIWPEECERWSQEMTAEDFYRPFHGAFFSLLKEQSARKPLLDLVTFLEEAESSGKLNACGGRAYVNTVWTYGGNPGRGYQKMAPEYARHVKEAAMKRRMTDSAAFLLEAAGRGETAEQLAAQAESLVTNSPLIPAVHSRSAREILWELSEKVDRRAENPRALLGLTTGLLAVDRMTNGLQAPNLVVIGARPGVGKSAVMTKMATHVAREGFPVLLFSLEMSQEEVLTRIVCSEARIDSHAMKAGRMTPDEYTRYLDAARWIYELPLTVNDRSGLTPAYMRGEIRKFIRQHGRVGLVCVDYIQLMRSDRPSDNRLQELTDVSIELKGIAREFSVPLIALSQLNRSSTLRQNKRPDLGDIRETGQIEQDADIVAFLYREDMFSEMPAPMLPDASPFAFSAPGKVSVEFIVRKNRSGPRGTVLLDFIDQFALFLDQPAKPIT